MIDPEKLAVLSCQLKRLAQVPNDFTELGD